MADDELLELDLDLVGETREDMILGRWEKGGTSSDRTYCFMRQLR